MLLDYDLLLLRSRAARQPRLSHLWNSPRGLSVPTLNGCLARLTCFDGVCGTSLRKSKSVEEGMKELGVDRWQLDAPMLGTSAGLEVKEEISFQGRCNCADIYYNSGFMSKENNTMCTF